MKTAWQTTHTHAVSGKATTATGGHSHDLAEVVAAIAALDARLDVLEGEIVVPPPPVPPPPVEPPPVTPPPEPPPVTPPTGSITVPVGGKGVTITRDNQVVENLTITGPSALSDGKTYGIFGSGAYTGTVIRNCTIRNFGHSGIWLVGLSNVVIEDCLIEDVCYAGIYLVGVTGGRVSRVKVRRVGMNGPGFASNNAYGICVGGISKISSDVLVEDCEVIDVPMWHGIDTHGGLRITFRHNTVRRTPRACFITSLAIAKATDCKIENNLFTEPVSVAGGTDPGEMTAYDTVRCAFTGNHIGAAYGTPRVYDYAGLSVGLMDSGNVTSETLP